MFELILTILMETQGKDKENRLLSLGYLKDKIMGKVIKK
jgi:hypothetical protein